MADLGFCQTIKMLYLKLFKKQLCYLMDEIGNLEGNRLVITLNVCS